MRLLLIGAVMLLALNTRGQEPGTKARVFKDKNVNIFVKCEPLANYEVLDEIKVNSAFKSTKTQGKMLGAGGYNKIQYAIEEYQKTVDKAAKKGKTIRFNGVLVEKPRIITIISLDEGSVGTGPNVLGAEAYVNREEKTGKLVFFASKPLSKYRVISSIKYDQGFNETMRGGNEMDMAINAMLDQGLRWVKKGKIEDFEAIIVDWRALRSGYVRGELIELDN